MIVSFGDKATEEFYCGEMTAKSKRLVPPKLRRKALYKLDMLDAAHALKDLKTPPGNRLEKLKGNFEGMHSIRINDQFRIVFHWDGGAERVRIVDYH